MHPQEKTKGLQEDKKIEGVGSHQTTNVTTASI